MSRCRHWNPNSSRSITVRWNGNRIGEVPMFVKSFRRRLLCPTMGQCIVMLSLSRHRKCFGIRHWICRQRIGLIASSLSCGPGDGLNNTLSLLTSTILTSVTFSNRWETSNLSSTTIYYHQTIHGDAYSKRLRFADILIVSFVCRWHPFLVHHRVQNQNTDRRYIERLLRDLVHA